MKRYEEKGIEWLISKPRGLFLVRRRRSLRRAEGVNKIFVSLILLSFGALMIGCKSTPKDENNKEKMDIPVQQESLAVYKDTEHEIYPDTTINKKLLLTDYYSTENFYPDYKKLSYNDITEYGHPFILFSNQSITQYLMAYTYEGGTKNAFDCFEIGYQQDEKKLIKLNHFKTNEQNFETESGIKLGMLLVDLIKRKGNNYAIEADLDTIITY